MNSKILIVLIVSLVYCMSTVSSLVCQSNYCDGKVFSCPLLPADCGQTPLTRLELANPVQCRCCAECITYRRKL